MSINSQDLAVLLLAGRVFFNYRRKLATRDPEPMLVQFVYINWHGHQHTYVVLPESIEFGRPGDATDPDEQEWMFHGELVTRDGDTRPHMFPSRRRSFRVRDMVNVHVLEPEQRSAD
jgi:hypothetical protein